MSVTAIISIILAVFGIISGIIFNFYRTNRILKENKELYESLRDLLNYTIHTK